MSNSEAENISRYLRAKEIQLPANNKWLLDCINWYKTNFEVRNIYHCIEDYVCIQWLLADLRNVQHRCLPTNCKDGIIELTGKYCVQVNWVHDISQPCYTQLQAIQNSNIADSNEHVSAEETRKQNWEPSPKRVLMMEITDGFSNLKAMEYSPISKLKEPFIPGFKVVLNGPIECRKGVLLLKSNSLSLLGGEVDDYGAIYSKENMLKRYLNITPAIRDGPARDPNGAVTTSSPAPNSLANSRVQPSFSDADQLPDSTSFIESNNEDNREAVMVDDDDDVLLQLPDTMFNEPDKFEPQLDRQFPVSDEELEEVQSSTHENLEEEPVFRNRNQYVNKPKLFPSMEDLRPKTESSSARQCSLNSLGRNSKITQFETPSTSELPNNKNVPKSPSVVSKSKLSNEKHNLKAENSNIRKVELGAEEVEPYDQNELNFNDSIGNHIDDIVGENKIDNVYPQFKRVNVNVLSITKLKVRNGEWICCGTATIENKTENVTFCDKVMERVLGTTAAEVAVLRSELEKNQSLKEKINEILRTGQTKLKLLNCLMIVEYSSEDCTPNIISIHEESLESI